LNRISLLLLVLLRILASRVLSRGGLLLGVAQLDLVGCGLAIGMGEASLDEEDEVYDGENPVS
jgi:hypothetical protein